MTRSALPRRRRLVGLVGLLSLAAAGLATPTATAVRTSDGLMDVTITQTNPSADGRYDVGDTLTYDLTLTNTGSQDRSFSLHSTNLGGRVAACKWRRVAAGQTKTDCQGFATHQVTAADLEAGGFTPEVSYVVKAPDYVGEALSTPEVIKGETSSIAGPRTPSEPEPPVSYPEAQPAVEPNVDPSLPAELTDDFVLASNTSANNYRIPAITSAPNGDVLVAYDERPLTGWDMSGGDSPNPNSIVQRRSTDNGRTWGQPTYIDRGSMDSRETRVGYSDPSYVVDWETGAIFNFHVKSYDVRFQDSQAGTDPANRKVAHAQVAVSYDNGYTWTSQTITSQVTNDASWVSRFAASGQGIQLKYGAHKGRLVQQFTIKLTSGAYQAVSVYSDDHGKTWRAGTPVGTGMDENKVVELSDGTLMLNSRSSSADLFRKVALSSDGGETWGDVTVDKNLPDPRNNAQIIRAYPSAPEGSAQAKILLFTNAAASSGRTHGTVKMSCNNGMSWSSAREYESGHVGYTTIAVQPDGSIGLVTEEGGNTITYHRMSLAWLGGLCASVTAPETTVLTTETQATIAVTVENLSAETLTGQLLVSGLPAGLSAEPVAVTDLAPGARKELSLSLQIEEGALSQGRYALPLTLTVGSSSATGQATLVVKDPTAISEDHLSIADYSSQNMGGGEITPATNVIDGDPATFWHSRWSSERAAAPHHVTLKIDKPYDLTRVGYTPRTGSKNGVVKDYRVLVAASVASADGQAVCPADEAAYQKAAEGTVAGVAATEIALDEQVAKNVDCVRFVILTDQSGGNYGSAAEIGLFGQAVSEEPGEPVVPEPSAEPSEPVVPEPSAEPSEPVVPEPSAEPSEPVVPEPSAEPSEPVVPEPSAEPSEPVVPEPSAEPSEPVVPEPSAEPSEPVVPEPSEQSSQAPVTPGKPEAAPDGGKNKPARRTTVQSGKQLARTGVSVGAALAVVACLTTAGAGVLARRRQDLS